jgi:hypothetical protein
MIEGSTNPFAVGRQLAHEVRLADYFRVLSAVVAEIALEPPPAAPQRDDLPLNVASKPDLHFDIPSHASEMQTKSTLKVTTGLLEGNQWDGHKEW